MEKTIATLIERLETDHSLSLEQYKQLIEHCDKETAAVLAEKAVAVRKRIYGKEVYTRGLIEISNYCKNDCYYCGIRRGNTKAQRYRLRPEEILDCAREGVALGFGTIVLQGGEDPYYTDDILCSLIQTFRQEFPQVALTLSLGERSRDSYQRLYDAGANRYLLRHETADKEHYQKLHPKEMSFENRMRCIRDLKDIGFQTGIGFMVGSPYQSAETLAKDLKFIETFHPDMCGIGPFIAHHDTPFAACPNGTLELTCFLLSIVRLIWPPVLLPSTTALGTIDVTGREKGILAGANVVMPNLSPKNVRAKYELYDNKVHSGAEAAQSRELLRKQMDSIDYCLVDRRGDIKLIAEGSKEHDKI